jgi:hypothetical protein
MHWNEIENHYFINIWTLRCIKEHSKTVENEECNEQSTHVRATTEVCVQIHWGLNLTSGSTDVKAIFMLSLITSQSRPNALSCEKPSSIHIIIPS